MSEYNFFPKIVVPKNNNIHTQYMVKTELENKFALTSAYIVQYTGMKFGPLLKEYITLARLRLLESL